MKIKAFFCLKKIHLKNKKMNTGIIHFEAFLIAAILFIASPGIDTMFVMNKSLTQGKKAGIFSTLGINAGVIVHTLFAALGLSWLIAQSAMTFIVIKYLGAAYLIYLGVRSFSQKEEKEVNVQKVEEKGTGKVHFTNGLITNIFNPKVALFFLSFFPQFIAPSAIHNKTPFLLLGITYAGIGIIWFTIITFLSTLLASKVVGNHRIKKIMNKCAGIVFILMGLKIAFIRK